MSGISELQKAFIQVIDDDIFNPLKPMLLFILDESELYGKSSMIKIKSRTGNDKLSENMSII